MGMIDKEKVLHGLSSCGTDHGIPNICEVTECPYREDKAWCVHALAHDARMLITELLKAQEPRVLTLRELAFYDAGIFVETRNGCPEGLTDELWPALGHLYCVSQNGEHGYVSFVNWNADTYDFEAKDYNVEFRCWTSRPTDEQREAVKWDD